MTIGDFVDKVNAKKSVIVRWLEEDFKDKYDLFEIDFEV